VKVLQIGQDEEIFGKGYTFLTTNTLTLKAATCEVQMA